MKNKLPVNTRVIDISKCELGQGIIINLYNTNNYEVLFDSGHRYYVFDNWVKKDEKYYRVEKLEKILK